MIITIFHDNQNTLSKVIFKIVVTNSAELFRCKLNIGHNLYQIIDVRLNNSFIFLSLN